MMILKSIKNSKAKWRGRKMMFDWLIEKIVSAEKQNPLRHRLVLAGVLTVSMTVTMMPVAALAETMSDIQGGGY